MSKTKDDGNLRFVASTNNTGVGKMNKKGKDAMNKLYDSMKKQSSKKTSK